MSRPMLLPHAPGWRAAKPLPARAQELLGRALERWLALWLALGLCASVHAQEPSPASCLSGNCMPPEPPSSSERQPSFPAGSAEPAPAAAPAPPALPPLPPCVTRDCTTRPSLADPMLKKLRSPPPRQVGIARGVAIFGVVSAALTLSGSIAIATQDSLYGERVGRGLMLGLSAVSTPIIAISTLVVRRQLRVKGLPALRRSFWAFYLAAVVTDSLFLHRALQGDQIPVGISVAAGATSAIAVLGYAYDAFITSRQARSVAFAMGFGPRGAQLRLRF